MLCRLLRHVTSLLVSSLLVSSSDGGGNAGAAFGAHLTFDTVCGVRHRATPLPTPHVLPLWMLLLSHPPLILWDFVFRQLAATSRLPERPLFPLADQGTLHDCVCSITSFHLTDPLRTRPGRCPLPPSFLARPSARCFPPPAVLLPSPLPPHRAGERVK